MHNLNHAPARHSRDTERSGDPVFEKRKSRPPTNLCPPRNHPFIPHTPQSLRPLPFNILIPRLPTNALQIRILFRVFSCDQRPSTLTHLKPFPATLLIVPHTRYTRQIVRPGRLLQRRCCSTPFRPHPHLSRSSLLPPDCSNPAQKTIRLLVPWRLCGDFATLSR